MSVRQSYIARIRSFEWENVQTKYQALFVPLGSSGKFEKHAQQQWSKQVDSMSSLDDSDQQDPLPSNLIGIECEKVLVVIQKPMQAAYAFDTGKELTEYEAATKLQIPLVVGKEIARVFNRAERAEWANPLSDQESQDLLQMYIGLSDNKEELKDRLEIKQLQLERAYEKRVKELEEKFKIW